jgi:Mg-chelatase subunit ChlD
VNLKQTDRVATRLQSLAATFAKTDRILTGNRSITVRVSTSSKTKTNAPGFSDGQNITINSDQFKNIGSAVSLVRLLGLNYHELSHIMFTPRMGTEIRKQVVALKLNRAINVLEDQRIETLFSALYKPAGKYFTEMCVEFFVDKDETWSQAHLFTHGRRYLPLEIREEFSKRFAGTDEDKKRAEEIIDEYRLLDLTAVGKFKSGQRATEVVALVKEFSDIMKRASAAAGEQSPNPNDVDDEGTKGCGRPEKGQMDPQQREASQEAQEQSEDQDEVEEDGEDGSGFWDEFDDEEESDEDEEGDEDDEEDDGSGEGGSSSDDDDLEDEDDGDGGSSDESGDLEDEDEDSDSDSDSSEGGDDGEGDDGEAGGSAGSDSDESSDGDSDSNEHGDTGTDTPGLDNDELRDVLNDILNAVMGSDQVQGDIRRLHNAINDPSSLDVDGDNRQSRDGQEPPSAALSESLRDVQREFRRLWAAVEPGWKYGSDEGRLNVQRAMTSDDYEDVFDEWDEGREHDSGLEVFIALDTSGSMMGQEILDASAALWIIKRACDELDASVSCVAFGAVTKTIYQRGEKADKTLVTFFDADGGDTRPGQSLRIGRRILSQSDKANKLFVIITDGGWSVRNDEHELNHVENMGELIKSIPATTLFIGVGRGGQGNAFAQHFDVSKGVGHTSDIAPLLKQTITTMLRNRVAQVR